MKPSIAQIIAAVAEAFHIRPADITEPDRSARASHPRFIAYAIAHDAGHSYPQIGRFIGRRDHSTVISGAKRAKAIAKKRPDYAETFKALRKSLLGARPKTPYRDWQFKSIRSAS